MHGWPIVAVAAAEWHPRLYRPAVSQTAGPVRALRARSVIAPRHCEPMAEPATPLPRRRIELPLLEARTRLTQIVRLTPVTAHLSVIPDRGRPVAKIVPADAGCGETPSPVPKARTDNAAAGWMRRIEQVREAVRRQHAMRISELEHALTDAWDVIDRVAPRASDRAADELRVAQRDVMSKPPPAASSPARSS